MRRTKLFGAAPLVAALVLVGTTPAGAGVAMRASLEGHLVGLDQNPAHVAARCPPGSPQAIVSSAGSGAITSGAYTGPVTFTASHCTLLLAITKHEVIPLRVQAGRMTISTSQGDLYVTYMEPGVFTGDLSLVGPHEHKANGPYTITGGTGNFDGASGHGHMWFLEDGSASLPIDFNGTLALAG